MGLLVFFFFSSRRRHTRCSRDWSSDVCSSDLMSKQLELGKPRPQRTKIVIALGPGTSAHAVAQVGVRCAAKIGDPPAGSSLALRAAKTAISRGHCKVGRITKAYSAKVKTGLVISQSPAAGKHLKNGAKVNL